jgi:hypothetical protein
VKTEAGITRADEHHFFASKEKPLYHLPCERFEFLHKILAVFKNVTLFLKDHSISRHVWRRSIVQH